MLFLERQRKPINNTPEDLEEFGNPVEMLRFVDKLEKDVVDGAADKGTETEEFTVYSVESGL